MESTINRDVTEETWYIIPRRYDPWLDSLMAPDGINNVYILCTHNWRGEVVDISRICILGWIDPQLHILWFLSVLWTLNNTGIMFLWYISESREIVYVGIHTLPLTCSITLHKYENSFAHETVSWYWNDSDSWHSPPENKKKYGWHINKYYTCISFARGECDRNFINAIIKISLVIDG